MNQTSTTTSTSSITLADMERVVEMLKGFDLDPLAEWMRALGFDPDRYLLVLPEAMREKCGPFPPRYVRFAAVSQPYIMLDVFGNFAEWMRK